jgi:hypothetical protein
MDSDKAEIFIEFKWKTCDDLFSDVCNVQGRDGETVKCFVKETKAANNTLGQITTYAAAQLGSQFCTHVYSIFIQKKTARIL